MPTPLTFNSFDRNDPDWECTFWLSIDTVIFTGTPALIPCWWRR